MTRFGPFELRIRQRQLIRDGAVLRIGTRAFDLLLALIERRDRVVGADELRRVVWPGRVVEDNNLRVQLTHLRRLLGADAIVHHAREGYRFTPEIESEDGPSAAGAAPALPPNNLPRHLPPLYGRDAERAAVGERLARANRVTVVGMAGIGKTTLAMAAAHALRERYADGVWLIELAALTDASLLAETVATVLKLRLPGAAPASELADALTGRTMLLLLDNCEHLSPAVAALADALQRRAPTVHLLATSRHALKAAAEQVLALGPLDVADDGRLDSARASGAVALFEARARSADPRFSLGDGNVEAVVAICRQLDGNALALELAAARVPLLGVAGLRDRLDERLRLLTDRKPDRPSRHHSLAAALEWGHELLAAREQTILPRLGVFAGSFSLSAAQALCTDEHLDEWAVLDALGELIDQSLLMADHQSLDDGSRAEPRYLMHESVRSFARSLLGAGSEAAALRQRHAMHFLAVALGPGGDESASQISGVPLPDADHDNARAALDWACEHDPALALRLGAALSYFWRTRGHHAEGRTRLTRLLAHPLATPDSPVRGRLLLGLCGLVFEQGDQAALQAHADASAALWRGLGDRLHIARSLLWLGNVAFNRGELDDALAHFSESLVHYRALGMDEHIADMLTNVGCVANALGQPDRARTMMEEALAIYRTLGSRWGIGFVIENLGEVAFGIGRYEEAKVHWQDALAEYRRLNHAHRLTVLLHALGRAQRCTGDLPDACRSLLECMDIARRQRFDGMFAEATSALAAVAAAEGDPDRAARLFGAAEALFTRTGTHVPGIFSADARQTMVAAQQSLAPSAWRAAFAAGGRMTAEEVLREERDRVLAAPSSA